MATKSNITIDQGSTFTVTVDLQIANGSPLDLSGYSGRAQMRKAYSASTAKDFTVSIANTSLGQVTMSMVADYTANVEAGRWLYDLEMINGSTVTRVLEGIATVKPEVTRS